MSEIVLSPLEFSSSNQSLWSTGDGSFSWTPSFTAPFEIDFDLDVAVLKAAVDLVGQIGIEFGLVANVGSIDTNLTYLPTIDFVDGLRGRPGTAVTYFKGTTQDLLAGRFSTDPTSVEFYVDLLYELQGTVDLSILGKTLIDLDIDMPTVAAPKNSEGLGAFGIVSITPGRVGFIENVFSATSQYLITQPIADTSLTLQANVKDPGVKLNIRSDTFLQDPSVATVPDSAYVGFDLATVAFKIPQVSASGEYLPREAGGADNAFGGSGAANFAEMRFDLDGILTYVLWHVFRIPFFPDVSLKFDEFKWLSGSVGLTLADIDFGPDLRLRQDVTVEPGELDARFDFLDMDGNLTDVGILNPDTGAVEMVSTWFGAWNSLPEVELTEAVKVVPTLSTDAQVISQTGLEIGATFVMDLLRLKYSINTKNVPFLGANSVGGQLGPLYQLSLTEDDIFGDGDASDAGLFIPFLNADTLVDGFDRIELAPFILDVEGTDDPGRSGLVSDRNRYDPVAVDDDLTATVQVEEGGFAYFDPKLLLANDYDLDALDTLSVFSVSGIEGTVRAWETRDGQIALSASDTIPGLTTGVGQAVELTYEVRDALGHITEGSFEVSVIGREDLAVATPDAFVAFSDGSTDPLSGATFGSVLDNDFDPDVEDVVTAIAGSRSTLLGGTVVLQADGTFTYDPGAALSQIIALDPGALLLDRFTYAITTDGVTLEDSAEATIAIVGENASGETAAVYAVPSTVLTVEGMPATEVFYVLTDRPTWESKPDEVTDVVLDLSVTDASEVTLSTTSLVFTSDNWDRPQSVLLTPIDDGVDDLAVSLKLIAEISSDRDDRYDSLDARQTDVVVYDAPEIELSARRVTAAEGGADGVVEVTLNRPPVAGTFVVLDILTDDNDATGIRFLDASGAEITQLTFAEGNYDQPQQLRIEAVDDTVADPFEAASIFLSVNADASDATWLHARDQFFRVDIQDNEPGAPRARADAMITGEEFDADIFVLVNDADANGEALTVTAAAADNGTVEIRNNGEMDFLSYTPDKDFFGTDYITYTVSDPGGLTDTSLVRVEVQNINDAPVSLSLGTPVFTVREDETFSVDLGAFHFDPDGDTLRYAVVDFDTLGETGGGVASIEGSTLSFTMPVNYANADVLRDENGAIVVDPSDGAPLFGLIDGADPLTLVYSFRDGEFIREQTFEFLVIAEDDAPVTAPDVIEIYADQTLDDISALILGNDSDPDGDAIRVTDVTHVETIMAPGLGLPALDLVYPDGAPATQMEVDARTGAVSVTPAAGHANLVGGGSFIAEETFEYEVTDALGSKSTGQLTLRVIGVDDAPVGAVDHYALTLDGAGIQDEIYFFQVTDNDVDPDFGSTATLLLDTTDATSHRGASVAKFFNPGVFSYEIGGAFTLAPGEVVLDTFGYVGASNGTTYTSEVVMRVTGEGAAPAAGIVVSSGALEVTEEGADDTLWVALATRPTSDVVLSLVFSDDTEAASGDTALTFTADNWDRAQALVVQGVADGLFDGTQTSTLTLAVDDGASDDAYDGLSSAPVTVTTFDRLPSPDILVTKRILDVVEGGAGDSFDVILGQRPDSDVVIDVASTDEALLTADVTQLTFTPDSWNIGQTVTVDAVDNFAPNSDVYAGILLRTDDAASDDAFDGAGEGVVAFVTDDEALAALSAPPEVTFAGPGGPVVEGNVGVTEVVFTATRTGAYLAAESSVNYTVQGLGGADASDFAGGVLPRGTVVFAPGETEQTLVVEIAGDTMAEVGEGFALTFGTSGYARVLSSTLVVGITDDDSPSPVDVFDTIGLNRLRGTQGPEKFILTNDAARDVLKNFDLARDVLDVSALGAQSLDDLSITTLLKRDGTPNWVQIADQEGDQELLVRFADGIAPDAAALTEDRFVFSDSGNPDVLPPVDVFDTIGFDRLRGTQGPEKFILTNDTARDVLKNFDLARDVLDVSALGAQSLDDLTITTLLKGDGTPNWVQIADQEGDQELLVRFADGIAPDAAALTEDRFVFSDSGNPDMLPPVVRQDEIGRTDLRGNSRADLFFMIDDGTIDLIRGFELGKDHIDVTAWGAGGLDDLTITDLVRKDGSTSWVRLQDPAGDAEVLLRYSSGTPLTGESLTADDFVFA